LPAQPVFAFTKQSLAAYNQGLKLKLENSRKLAKAGSPQDRNHATMLLAQNYTDFLELAFTQNPGRFDELLEAQEDRFAVVKDTPATPYARLSQAEIKLQIGISKFLNGSNIQAAWDLRQAYLLFEENDKMFPDFVANKKSYGLLQVLLGAVPENYKWALSIFGMSGNVKKGFQNMKLAAETPHPMQQEAQLLYSLMLERLGKNETEALEMVNGLVKEQPDNLLFLFTQVSMLKKLKQTDLALKAYQTRPDGDDYLSVPNLHHMAADLYLYKGDYARSVRENRLFLSQYRGKHYIKDAYFKLYLAYWLNQDKDTAFQYYKKIATEGAAVTEEDKYALQFYNLREQPDPVLMPARLRADGGYYREALNILADYDVTEQSPVKEKIEYFYRKARIYHGLNDLNLARMYYLRTISAAGNAPYYYAPNAALQLGYLYSDSGDKAMARTYFKKALTYQHHEYKNSIDSKAKMA
ncbi:MAG: DUF3808 domain-containing protein, partial [Hymenobacteraceae bacterium]|nr:DUF3808 domain-containing protein [Hymenobacteraceae bacterium]MDX5397809.1 DUF3808 domain-containing protein [Hymenobacteraceae bacterium]MDX5513888.1 DUF3808 domain-containing protein [Hymenobacteraceae bacterium]